MRRVLRRLLGVVPGLEVVDEAADGGEAVKLALSFAPEIVLLDCDMPRVDGPSAAELILSRLPQTRILLHGAGASQQTHAQATALVLLAMADRGGDGVLIVDADETIPFYNGIAASMLRLPLPAQPLSLSTVHERVRVVDQHGLPRGIEALPLSRALSARVATHASVICEYVVDSSRARFEMASFPFFSPGGEFIGVGNYLSAALN